MALIQRIENSTFNLSGSWTSINLSLTNNYYQRAFQSTKALRASDSKSIRDFVRSLEDFQKSIKDLAEELRLAHRCPLEYEDLAKTLDELCATTIPYVFYFFVEAHSTGRSLGRRLQAEITYMQIIIDEFSRKRTEDRNQMAQHLMTTNGLEAFLGHLWCYFSLLFYTRCLIPRIRQEMAASRLRVHAFLFESVVRAHWGRRILAHQIDIDDFFGARWSLPQDLCLDKTVFLSILRFKFRGGPAEKLVLLERFSILKQEGLEVIRSEHWEKAIQDGDGLQLSVRLIRQEPEQIFNACAQQCPRCERNDKTVVGSSENYTDCLRCNLSFNTKPLELDEPMEADGEEEPIGTEQTLGGSDRGEQPVFRFYSIVAIPGSPGTRNFDTRAELRRTQPYPSLPKRYSQSSGVHIMPTTPSSRVKSPMPPRPPPGSSNGDTVTDTEEESGPSPVIGRWNTRRTSPSQDQRGEHQQRREEEVDHGKDQEEAQRKEEELRWKEEMIRQKEGEARRKEEQWRMEAKSKEETRRKEEEFKRKEQEAKKKEQGVRNVKELNREEEEEPRWKEEQARQRAREREEDLRRRAEEFQRLQSDLAKSRNLQQEEFRKREVEIRRRKVDGFDLEAAWVPSSYRSASSFGGRSFRKGDEIRLAEEPQWKEEERLRLEQQEEDDSKATEELQEQLLGAKRREHEEPKKAREFERKEEEERRKEEEARRWGEEPRRAEEEAQKRGGGRCWMSDEAAKRRKDAATRRGMGVVLCHENPHSKEDNPRRNHDLLLSTAPQEKRTDGISWRRHVEQARQYQHKGHRSQGEQIDLQAKEHEHHLGGAQGSSSLHPTSGTHWASKPNKYGGTLQPTPQSASRTPASSYPSTFGGHGQGDGKGIDGQDIQKGPVRKQLARFREEQELSKSHPQAREDGGMPTINSHFTVYESHGRLWATVGSKPQLRWRDFPWPMFQIPASPEQITIHAVDAYLQSPHYPVTAKVKIYKDRIRDQLRRWNLDHVEKQALPRVPDNQKEAVREAVRSVARVLHYLNSPTNTQLIVPATSFTHST